MKFYVVNPDEHFERKWVKEIEATGHEGAVLYSKDFSIGITENTATLLKNGEPFTFDVENTFFLVRGYSRDIKDQHHFDAIFFEHLHRLGAKMSSEIYRFHKDNSQKMTMAIKCAMEGIPVPDQYIFPSVSVEEHKGRIEKDFSYPLVLKSRGATGKAVWKINSWEELQEKVSSRKPLVYIVQEYIPSTYDIRVLCYEDVIIGAMKRSSTDGFYNNISKAGRGEPVELTEEEKEIAQRASVLSGVGFSGVDIMHSPKGSLILEVNRRPGLEGYIEYVDVDIMQKLVAEIVEKQV